MGISIDTPPLTDFLPKDAVDATDENVALLTRAEYLDSVECGGLIDYDGFGYPVARVGDEYFEDPRHSLSPSNKGSDIPPAATHVNWFNK